jgi:orotate phosphoribosyltransferase
MVDLIKEFQEAEAILKGHFILSSGLHSDTYLQCARALMDTKRAERLCGALAKKVIEKIDVSEIDVVVAPAMGGVIVGFETSRQLGKPSIFCERVDGEFQFRRGFGLNEGQKVLVVEDVVTTAKSSLETIGLIESCGAKVICEAALINRGDKVEIKSGLPLITLEKIEVKTYEPNNLPPELNNIPAIKPGSRWISNKKA